MHEVRLLSVRATAGLGAATLMLGEVEVSSTVTGYVRRRRYTRELLDSRPLDCPEQVLRTRATWWTLPALTAADAGVPAADLPGALHAAEHAAIGLLPLFAGCDRADLGGLSTAAHPDTGLPTVVVHDGLPGRGGLLPTGGSRWRRAGGRPPRPRCATAGASTGARRACSHRSAVAATPRCPGQAPRGCWRCCADREGCGQDETRGRASVGVRTLVVCER